MIGRLQGTVLEKLPPDILLDVQGVGYEVQLPMTSFYQLPDIGAKVSLFTHFVVREDAQLLYGFTDKTERALFRELIKANGIGPKLACTILSGMSAGQFIQCVSHDDVSALVKVPGVGKKTAERLLVEFKDKLQKLTQSDSNFASSAALANDNQTIVQNFATAKPQDEAISALIALGYKANQAEKTVKAVFQEGMTSEEAIRESLKSMG